MEKVYNLTETDLKELLSQLWEERNIFEPETTLKRWLETKE